MMFKIIDSCHTKAFLKMRLKELIIENPCLDYVVIQESMYKKNGLHRDEFIIYEMY